MRKNFLSRITSYNVCYTKLLRQELAVPVIGTGRGRLRTPRKKMIALIAESFVKASIEGKFTDRLVITIRPEDAENFGINLYDIKDHLMHVLK